MPEMDGLEATRRLYEQDPDIRVVMLTGGGDETLGLRGLRAGAAGFLSKDMELDAAAARPARRARRRGRDLAPAGDAARPALPQRPDRRDGPAPRPQLRSPTASGKCSTCSPAALDRGHRTPARALDRDRPVAPEEPLPQARGPHPRGGASTPPPGCASSSSAAVSLAGQSSTSRRISTARVFGGRCWIATMNASSIVSLRERPARSGSASGSAIPSSSSSGYGCSHGTSPPRGLRGLRCSASRQALVAIRYSQARGVERPWKVSRRRQARRNVSWTRSSDSSSEPSIR